MNAPKPWWPPQKKTVVGLAMALVMYGGIQAYKHFTHPSKPQSSAPTPAQVLANKIDPNTADAATLSVLPQIGEKRAAEIIAYREIYVRDHPHEVAFRSAQDLTKVRGIGTATMEEIQSFLILPADRPQTQP